MNVKKEIIQLKVSEPWNFEIPGKGNVLKGVAEGSCHGPAKENWQGEYLLISLAETITWKGETIKQLLIAPRYEGDKIEEIQRGRAVTVGIARVRPGASLKPSESFRPSQVDYFAIGSAQLCS